MRRHSNSDRTDWHLFTGRPTFEPPLHAVQSAIQGKRILITGAGGSIGAVLASAVAERSPASLILLDQAELGLHDLQQEFAAGDHHEHTHYIVGSVLDTALLNDVFRCHQPEIVFHAAACKHVPLMETNPFAAVTTNALGTQAVFQIASAHGTEQCILLSTDKAVEPNSIMGATKQVAEQIVRNHTGVMQAKALRLGNVLDSLGSVVPLFFRQIARGGPVTVTHPDATRFFFPIDGAVNSLLATLTIDAPSAVLVPNMGRPHRIHELAQFLIARHAPANSSVEIEFIGLRPGDKLEERMISRAEKLESAGSSGLQLIRTPTVFLPALKTTLQDLQYAVLTRDIDMLLQAITAVVPDYSPSESIRNELRHTSLVERA